MKIITNLKDANILLRSYVGATCQVCIFSISLKRMALKLILPNVSEVVYIVAISCESIKGRFSFTNADLSITSKVDKETQETLTTIIDKQGNFELITSGGFSLAKGLEIEFGTSFEKFLKN